MKITKSIFLFSIIITMMAQIFQPVLTRAAIIYIQPKPANLDLARTDDGEYDISYSKSEDKHKIGFKWNQVEASNDVKAGDTSQNGTIQESGYKIYTSTDNINFNQYPANIDWGSGDNAEMTFTIDSNGSSPFKSGTVYYSYVTAYHKHVLETEGSKGTETVHESLPSNIVIFLTEIEVSVSPNGTDSIQIMWDDVKYKGARIDYDIEISQSKDFIQPRIYNVRQQNISALGPVIPVEGTSGQNNKLKINITGSDYGIKPGTLYYIRIKPKNVSILVRYKSVTQITVGYTNIIASMVRLSDEWWRIDWNAITDSSLGADQQIMYKIKRGRKSDTNPILVTIAETSDRRYPVNVTGGNYFFIVVAEVKDQYGNYIPDGIQSQRLYAVETEVPVEPEVPEIQNEIRTYYPNGEIVYSIENSENLNSKKAVIAWLPPKFPDGTVDSSIVYDIWFLTNAEDIDSDTAKKEKVNYKIGSDASSGYIRIGDNIAAYKTEFSGLKPNTTYYLKIVAKKLFTISGDGVIKTKYYESQPALKVVVTPADGEIDRPLAPVKPPFKIKQDSKGIDMVGTNDVTVEWKKEWYEQWDGSKWTTVTQEVYNSNSGNALYRHNLYDDGVTFRIGYTIYQNGMDYESIKSLPVQITNISVNAQGWKVENLTPNTIYVMWLKAYRKSMELESEPSDPIIVVTAPDDKEIVVKPTTPYFTFSKAGDTYISLKWNSDVDNNYTYYIKYSTSDNLANAANSITVTPSDLRVSVIYTIEGLQADTVYYFWIQADSTGKKVEAAMSQWSDSYVVKTEKYKPPEIPIGFGIKNSEDAITKNSLTFEWEMVKGLEYRLEIDIASDFSTVKSYSTGSVKEYKVEGLRSNYRYYARLYAYDPEKKLESKPTKLVTVRTQKSNDEYDFDEDVDINYSGPSVTNAVYDNVWTFMINKVNAERLIEIMKTDAYTDYTVDMTNIPTGVEKRALTAPGSFFEKLSAIRENIILNIGTGLIVIRPYVLNKNQFKDSLGNLNDFTYRIEITTESKTGKRADNSLIYKSDAITLGMKAIRNIEEKKINSLDGKLKIAFKFEKPDTIEDIKSSGYLYNNETKVWSEQEITRSYDEDLKRGFITFSADRPGAYSVLQKQDSGSLYADMNDSPAKEELNALASKYKLKSLKESLFKPNQNMTVDAAVKLILDILEYEYGNDYIKVAYKAGLINENQMSNTSNSIKKNEFLNMLNRFYEIKTGASFDKTQYSTSGDIVLTRENAIIELYNKLKEMGEF